MSAIGQWFGQWAGQWFGTTEAAPPGSMAGTGSITLTGTAELSGNAYLEGAASISVGGAGTLSGTATLAGSAAVTLTGTGTLTDTGGTVPDTRLDQILAILMGRKVYDETTRLWRVYDTAGNELADPSGILLRGLHGFLLANATGGGMMYIPFARRRGRR